MRQLDHRSAVSGQALQGLAAGSKYSHLTGGLVSQRRRNERGYSAWRRQLDCTDGRRLNAIRGEQLLCASQGGAHEDWTVKSCVTQRHRDKLKQTNKNTKSEKEIFSFLNQESINTRFIYRPLLFLYLCLSISLALPLSLASSDISHKSSY